MAWFVFAFLTAFFSSLKDILSKNSLSRVDEYLAAWSLRFFAFLTLFPLLLFIEIPPLGPMFWVALLLSGAINTVSTILLMKALKSSDISLSIPLINMEPLFLLAAAPLILGEFPSGLGLIGVFLIMSGAYLLNLKENQKGIFSPIKAILQEKGPRLMIIVAMLWSISSSIDKVGLTNSSAAFWVICLNGFLSLSLFPLMALKSKSLDELPKNLKLTAPAGFFNGIANLFQMIAFSMTLVIYVASIKKLSSVLTVIYGGIMLKEKGLKRRLAATLLMVLGSIVILLGA